MFKKSIIILTLMALLASCAPMPQTDIVPVPEPPVQTKAEETMVPAGGSFSTAEGLVLQTPVPVRVPTPPVFQEEYDGLSVYYVYKPINWLEVGQVFVPVGTVAGAAAMSDGFLPVMDALAVVVAGGVILGFIVKELAAPPTAFYFEGPEDLLAILALWGSLMAYIPVSEDHDPNHTVILGSTNVATLAFADLMRRWPPDPNEQDLTKKVMCYVLKYGDEIFRHLVWAGTHMSKTGIARGNLIWYQFGPNGPEVYGYTNKSLSTMQNVPTDLAEKGYEIVPYDCNNTSPPFTLIGQ